MTDTQEVQKSRPAEPAAAKTKSPSISNITRDAAESQTAVPHSDRPQTPDVPSSHRPLRPESPGAIAGSGGFRPSRPESPLTERIAKYPAAPPASDPGISSDSRPVQSANVNRESPETHPDPDPTDAQAGVWTPRRKLANLPIWVYAAAAAGILLIVVIIAVWALIALTGGQSSAGSGHSLNTSAASKVHFLGIPIESRTVVFSLDGSSANTESFNLLVADLKNTVQKLPAATRVRIAIWTPTGLKVFPTTGWLTSAGSKAVFHSLLAYSPYGSTSMKKMIIDTLKIGANQNIFTTQKIIAPAGLLTAVHSALRPGQKIDVISIDGEKRKLEKLAISTGGMFKMQSLSDLQPSSY